ncbi:hypothetical protein AAFF_G00030700 [Aldrovandia affinis]|uniref:Uncharacterized protein n=1 Tax=Aldrovandia affinis TaxID=143900 RepID=A0AAD7S434_9TELE|nr:hypothetical protein AAFF_G00030700 [Aldrovandia affinis]
MCLVGQSPQAFSHCHTETPLSSPFEVSLPRQGLRERPSGIVSGGGGERAACPPCFAGRLEWKVCVSHGGTPPTTTGTAA